MSESPGAPDGGPYPDPRNAFLLTIAAFVASPLSGALTGESISVGGGSPNVYY